MTILSVSQLSKSFDGMPVLKEIDFETRDGEFLTLLGPSGCGKSTLLRVIAGLERQNEGEIRLNGERIDCLRPARRNVAMVFQSYALYPYMTVARNIATPLEMARLSQIGRLPAFGRLVQGRAAIKAKIDSEVSAVAESLEISHLLDRKPSQLSGGQRQRVALARAMVRNPRLFLMDEPLSNLDAALRAQMRSEIRALSRRLRETFIFVTHDQTEAMAMSDRIAVMIGGRIQQLDTPHTIYDRPANLEVAKFVGSTAINCFSARIDAGNLSSDLLPASISLPGAFDGPATLCIRPDRIYVGCKGPLTVSGKVRDIEPLGSDTVLRFKLFQRGEDARAQLRQRELMGISVGENVKLSFDPGDLHVFDAAGKRIELKASVLEVAT
ncbi:ABC transporter ATP-binding protein [Roseibium sp. M-1]